MKYTVRPVHTGVFLQFAMVGVRISPNFCIEKKLKSCKQTKHHLLISIVSLHQTLLDFTETVRLLVRLASLIR